MSGSSSAWVRRELRRRVDALHRQREKVRPPDFNAAVERNGHLHDDLRDAPPLTLAFDVAEELHRRGRSNVVAAKMSGQLHIKAMQEAKWAATLDDSPRACAVFAVDMAVNWARRPLRFDTSPPGAFVKGQGRSSYFDALKNAWLWPTGSAGKRHEVDDDSDPVDAQGGTASTVEVYEDDEPESPDTTTPVPLAYSDMARLRKVVPNLVQVFESEALAATWSPKYPRTINTCDVIRPPVEALAFIKQVFEFVTPSTVRLSLTVKDTPAAQCVGGGWGGTAQALSALLPTHWVYHQPEPYHDPLPLPDLDWQLVVLNVPSRFHWQVAKTLKDPGQMSCRDFRSLVRNITSKGGGSHVRPLVRSVLTVVKKNTIVALAADHHVHQQAVGYLRAGRNGVGLVPLTVKGRNTGECPIWVGYEKQPWTPHGLPRPTGRLVSFWQVQA